MHQGRSLSTSTRRGKSSAPTAVGWVTAGLGLLTPGAYWVLIVVGMSRPYGMASTLQVMRTARLMEQSTEPKCWRCEQSISATDAFSFAGDHIVHLDCGRPRTVSPEERALLFRHCFDHSVAECATCVQSYRQSELGSDLVNNRVHLCPNCRADLTESVRAHLYSCATLPEELRRSLHGAREAVGKLIQRSASDPGDLLMREAETAVSALRDMLRRFLADG